MVAVRGRAGMRLAALAGVLILSLPLTVLLIAAVSSASLTGLPEGGIAYFAGEYGAAWTRSATAAVSASLAAGALGLAGAWQLAAPGLRPANRPSPFGVLTHLSPLAVMPLLVGGASFAFLFQGLGRSLVQMTGSDARGAHSIIIVEVVAQTLRYGPLLLWLMILSVLEVPPGKRRYCQQAGLSGDDYIRTELAGRWRAPFLVVVSFSFQDAVNDHVIAQMSVRPSIATGTELMSHVLERRFSVLLSLGPPPAAINEIVLAGLLAGAGFAAVFAALSLGLIGGLRAIGWRGFDGAPKAKLAPQRNGWSALWIPVSVLCLGAASFLSLRPLSWASIGILAPSALAAGLSAAIAWAIAAPLIYILRDRLFVSDGSASRIILLMSGLAIGVGFVPTHSLAVAIFAFAFSTGFSGGAANGMWLVLAEVVRFAPVIFVLLAPSMLAIPDQGIGYLKSAGTSLARRGLEVFLAPNFVLHLVVIFIAFNLIMNEGVISSVFQAHIPSLTDVMRRATTGRSANAELAGTLVVLEACVFGPMLWWWGRTASAAWRFRHAH